VLPTDADDFRWPGANARAEPDAFALTCVCVATMAELPTDADAFVFM
jgi:hypothetical protein